MHLCWCSDASNNHSTKVPAKLERFSSRDSNTSRPCSCCSSHICSSKYASSLLSLERNLNTEAPARAPRRRVFQKVRTSLSCLQRASLRFILPCSYHTQRSTDKHGPKVVLLQGTRPQTHLIQAECFMLAEIDFRIPRWLITEVNYDLVV
jgi:hypothetical protein